MAPTPSFGLIINPNSGTKRDKQFLEKELVAFFAPEALVVYYTEGPLDALRKAKEWVSLGFSLVAVCGGDGTLNEVARALVGSDCRMFIVPMGSGNGFARHFKLRNWKDALAKPWKEMTTVPIQIGELNGVPFWNVAGIGFDAKLASLFQESKARGFWSYLGITFRAIFTSSILKTFVIQSDSDRRWWWIVFANGSQYGNDFYLHPDADPRTNDLTALFIPKPSFWKLGKVMRAILKKQLHLLPNVEIKKVKNIQLQFQENIPCHVDGEPLGELKSAEIGLLHGSVNLLVHESV
jgi:diacylglycerol kinase (ATP)